MAMRPTSPSGGKMTKGKSIKDLTQRTAQLMSKSSKDLQASVKDVKSRLAASPMQTIAEGINSSNQRTFAEGSILEKEKLVEEWDEHMPKLYRVVRGEVESLQAFQQSGEQVAQAFTNYPGKVTHAPSSQLLSSFLGQIATAENEFSVLKEQLANALSSEVVIPLRDFTTKEIPRAKEAKRKWNQARIAHDASQSKFKTLSEKGAKDTKVKEAEAECSSNKAIFENVNRETNQQLSDIIDAGESEHVQAMLAFLKSYKKFFEGGHQFFQSFGPQMEAMEQFCKQKTATADEPDRPKEMKQHTEQPQEVRPKQTEFIPKEERLRMEAADSSGDERRSGDEKKLKKSVSIGLRQTAITNSEAERVKEEETNDVGDLLTKIMEKENAKVEQEYQKWQQDREQKRKQEEVKAALPPVTFDYDAELKYGSSFHKYMMSHMKDDLIPGLMDQLDKSTLAAMDEEVDTGKFGQVFYGLGAISMQNVNIPLESVHLSFTDKSMTVTWSGITASLKAFTWYYKRPTFPKLKDKGTANASIEKGIISVTVAITRGEKRPVLKLESVAAKIGAIDIKVSGSGANVLYNLMLTAFSNIIRAKVQEELQTLVSDLFETQLDDTLTDYMEYITP